MPRYSLPVGLDGGLAVVPPSLPEGDWLAPLLVPVAEEPEEELPAPLLPLAPLEESLPDGEDALPLRPLDEPDELPAPDEEPEDELPTPDDELPMPELSTPRALAVLSSRRPVTVRLLDF
jgi:hypothetical protein